jgi:dTDP-4-amino-4,6-dideoxygalactose transaminase
MKDDARNRYRGLIGETLGLEADRVTLFSKGRVALYAILRALDVGPGDEVIVPAFTCVAVPNAIMYTGARPVWVDIEPTTYCIDPSAVESAVSARTRAILAQNTFGLSADVDALTAIASRRGVVVVDDCAHGLGGRYRGRPNGTLTPVSFFSTQWSKPLSTGLGGFAVAADDVTAARLRELEAAATEPSAGRAAALHILLLGRERAGNGRLLRGGRSAYRSFSRLRILPGSSDRDELEGRSMPEGFLARLSDEQARLGSERIVRLVAAVARRRSIAHRYTEWLLAHGRTPAPEPAEAEHAFLRYPIRVSERREVRATAERLGVDLGDWFVSPVHPLEDRLDRWGFVPGTAPNAERACREIVNLPTDPTLREHDVERVVALLEGTVDLVA